jgi:hypothetical protein
MEGIAYREAGHVLMAYLIFEAGIADSYFALPIAQQDRKYLVPDFEMVNADGELAELARPNFSLRSLITLPLFIFAGFAAQRIHEGDPPETRPGSTKLEGRATGMIASYIQEFGGSISGPDSRLVEASSDSYEFAEQEVQAHWPAVQALAQRLLNDKQLSREAAFEIIARHLSGGTKRDAESLAGEENPNEQA